MGTQQLSYLILASQRSGTEMLCHALADTGIAGRPAEYLLAADPEALPGWAFWEKGPFGVMRNATSREHYLEIVTDLGSSDNGVFGLKLMWSNMPWPLRKFEEMPAFAGMTRADIFHAAFPNLRKGIHVTRRDHVQQAVSWCRMAQDGVYIVTDDRPAQPTGEAKYNFEMIHAMVGIIEASEVQWPLFFDELGITPFRLVYEDFVAEGGYERSMRAVLDYLGLDASIQIPPPRTHKQANAINDEWLARYEADSQSTSGD